MTKCNVCEHEISNPVCPSCLSQEVLHWLADKDPRLTSLIHGGSLVSDGHNDACLFCNSDVSVCHHCYCKEMASWLKKDAPALVKPFKRMFDFGYADFKLVK